MEITLDELLRSRDDRSALQAELLGKYPGKTLVCLTVVMPGSVKRNSSSLAVAREAVQLLRQRFQGQIDYWQERDLQTGYEAFMVTPLPALETKAASCAMEDLHPLGRLFDIDVIGADGIPIPRSAVGGEPRKCLLCEHEARWCMRNRTHTQQEILSKIEEMTADYVHGV